MNLKRDNWTNDEVIALLKGCSIDGCIEDNIALEMAISLFHDMKADPRVSPSAFALDTETGLVVCVGPKLPQ